MQKIVISLICYLFSHCLIGQSIDRIEPPNWWVDMEHNEIELLIHGEGIGMLQVEAEYPGVTISYVKKAESPNYLFVGLRIAEDAVPGEVPLEFAFGSDRLFTHDYPLLDRRTDEIEYGYSQKDVVYLITPDRFANGDASNDNIDGFSDQLDRANKGGRHGGDIAGIRQRLDYIRAMGFTALWINPVMENNMATYSYHGYAITDFYNIDARHGSNEDYRSLVDEARAQGLKVIMDMVNNHCGSGHWWMEDLPFSDWVNQWEEYTQTNHKKTVFLDPYATEIDRKTFTDGWFVPTMPDMNQRNPSMAAYLIQNAIWWIEYSGIAGIRMDTYPYPDKDFSADWCRAILKEYPDMNIVGEEWYHLRPIIAYWQDRMDNPDGYRSYLPTVMDFPLQTATVEALNAPSTWQSSWTEVYQSLALDFLYPDPSKIMTFPDNHDMSRIFTQLNEDYEAWKLAMVLTLTTRGIPQVYYGTEILMTNPGTDDHGIIRSDFPGGWQGDAVNGFTGEGLTDQQREAQIFLRTILNWRKTSKEIHEGQLLHYVPESNDAYVFFRYTDTRKVMVILNKNPQSVVLDLKHYQEGLNGASRGREIISGRRVFLQGTLEVPGRTPLILELVN